MKKNKIKNIIKNIWRFPYRFLMSKRLKNHNFSIISANCIGGVLSHDLRQEFRSPTINLIIPQFIEFVERLDYYLAVLPIIGPITEKGEPTIYLDDIIVVGVHYTTGEQLLSDWNRRKQRVNMSDIYVIATDEFVKTKADYERFDSLPYKKVCFVSKERYNSLEKVYKWQIVCPEFKNGHRVGDVLRYKGIFGERIFERRFNFIKWLNQNEEKENNF